MAQIGLDHLVYAKLTKDDATGVTYEAPKLWAPAQSANINPNIASGDLPGDDGIVVHIDELTSITVTIGSTKIPTSVEADLLGKSIDANGAIGTNASNDPPEVAIGFRTKNAEGGYTYYWLYKGTFAEYQRQLQTKGTSVSFEAPSIVGTFKARLFDGEFHHKINDTDAGVNQTEIANWFDAVYGSGVPVTVTGISLVPSSANIAVGDVLQLTPNVSPANATNKAVTYTTSDPAIATVSASGKVTGIAAGTATITGHTVDGAFTDTCAVTVA